MPTLKKSGVAAVVALGAAGAVAGCGPATSGGPTITTQVHDALAKFAAAQPPKYQKLPTDIGDGALHTVQAAGNLHAEYQYLRKLVHRDPATVANFEQGVGASVGQAIGGKPLTPAEAKQVGTDVTNGLTQQIHDQGLHGALTNTKGWVVNAVVGGVEKATINVERQLG